MESSQAQVNDLHKKFEELNEEVSVALRVQQDAVASASTFGGRSNLAAARKDAVRLAKKTGDWRGDVTALAKHIDLQLQNSRALRSHYAQSLISTSAQKQQEEAEGPRLRCLRSDLRLLQDFRVRYFRQSGEKDPALLSAIEEETKQLKAFIDKNVKKEKMGGKQEQSPLALELFEMRREITSRISEDLLKEKKQLDVEVGNPEALANDSLGNNGPTEKDALASWDTQLYISFSPALEELQKEKRERLAAKSRNSVVSIAGAEGFSALVTESRAVSPTRPNSEAKSDITVEDVHFAMQKLKREVVELKSTNLKLLLTNSQLEDDLAHLQAKFEEEKRAHLNGKKWFVPKMQKLEDLILSTAKAFEEVKLSVELMTNMYKHLTSTLATQQEGEDELKRERDQVSLLLSSEIKKIAALTKENERKDRLVTLAMAARYEMVQHANRQEKLAKEACEQRNQLESRAHQAEAELATHMQQLQDTIERFEATNSMLSNAKISIVQLQGEVRATTEAAATKESELLAAFEKQQAALQQKLDKTKHELMESMSEMLNLDSRLRRTQEKLAKQAAGATSG
ncbi:hypothetical protein PF010_g7058 [Phytophthora fragariae]|uniref:Uncharacterized protein n=1 Tax=Phytophthora fragariae TaxID=53985 RepID=A0A6A3LDH0_9STRA|nr:hypothetical protein PF009_g8743 [Phytophthora fragariae]KAE9017471.1 hypothetical protein PF011_g6687 [Phytophthora fragariae]KAE9121565.1 hypothetical protein PF010_g7058 [Phytophthora fragariae]KAE9241570.1 hypothetical protein PF004_g6990 [Phytophthora fragariae]KAE9241961.1 hypothetical protein PF002_g8994 [Phytophthora fragariae]